MSNLSRAVTGPSGVVVRNLRYDPGRDRTSNCMWKALHHRTYRCHLVLPTLVVAFLFCGCDSTADPPDGILDRYWFLVEAPEAPTLWVPGETNLYLSSDGAFDAFATCNTYFGTHSLRGGGQISIDPQHSTYVGCDRDFEIEYEQRLESTNRYEYDERRSRLVLYNRSDPALYMAFELDIEGGE